MNSSKSIDAKLSERKNKTNDCNSLVGIIRNKRDSLPFSQLRVPSLSSCLSLAVFYFCSPNCSDLFFLIGFAVAQLLHLQLFLTRFSPFSHIHSLFFRTLLRAKLSSFRIFSI